MNIHLPAILGFTRYQGFDPSPVKFPAVFFSGNKTHQWYHWYQLVGGLNANCLAVSARCSLDSIAPTRLLRSGGPERKVHWRRSLQGRGSCPIGQQRCAFSGGKKGTKLGIQLRLHEKSENLQLDTLYYFRIFHLFIPNRENTSFSRHPSSLENIRS